MPPSTVKTDANNFEEDDELEKLASALPGGLDTMKKSVS